MDKKHAKGVFAEQLMAQKYRLERYTEDELIKLYTALNLVQDKIVRGWGKTIKTEYSQTQALAMLEEARKIMADIKPKIEGSIAGTLGKVSEESASVYSDMITFGGAARAAEVALLSAQQMESFWRYTPVGGQLLNEWVTKTFDGPTVDRIQREIFAGMFQGEGYREMVKRLQEGFVISKREADTLVRTYVHTANVHAMEEVYKKNRDVIAGVSWLTAFDKRTCMRCAALSGKLFPLDDHPPCPLHPRCRCVLVPETDIRKLKVKPKVADDWAKGLRDKRPPGLDTVLTPDGIPKTDFRRWILSQPEKDQLAFFGPTRYGLLKDGKIGWDDLFEETRFGGMENIRLRKLTELLGDRVVAHRAGKGYNVAVEQLALARAEREALERARHEAMAAKLDEKALPKAMKVVEKIVIGLDILNPDYVFEGVDYTVEKVSSHASIDWHKGKLHLNPLPFQKDAIVDGGMVQQAEWRPAVDLYKALEKAQRGEPLDFLDEASIRMLQHEAQHTWQKQTRKKYSDAESVFFEVVNEWTARRNYPDVLRKMGIEPRWAKEMKKYGYGYTDAVANLDALFSHYGIADDAALLDKMNKINRTTKIADFEEAIYNLIKDNKRPDAPPMKQLLVTAVENLGVKHERFMEGVFGKQSGGVK